MDAARKTLIRDLSLSGVSLAARLFVAAVFLIAAVPKIIDPYNFGLSIATYQMMPLEVINGMALLMPWLELAVAVLLIIGYRTRAAALLVTFMLMVFMIAIYQAIARDLMLTSCGCFASEAASDEVSWHTFIRDVIYLIPTLFVLFNPKDFFSLDYLRARRRQRKADGGAVS